VLFLFLIKILPPWHKAMMDKMFTDKLGNTDWIVESKGKVKLLTIFQKDGILILSTEPTSDHHSIIEKIKDLI